MTVCMQIVADSFIHLRVVISIPYELEEERFDGSISSFFYVVSRRDLQRVQVSRGSSRIPLAICCPASRAAARIHGLTTSELGTFQTNYQVSNAPYNYTLGPTEN